MFNTVQYSDNGTVILDFYTKTLSFYRKSFIINYILKQQLSVVGSKKEAEKIIDDAKKASDTIRKEEVLKAKEEILSEKAEFDREE